MALRNAGFNASYMTSGHYGWKAIGGKVRLFEQLSGDKQYRCDERESGNQEEPEHDLPESRLVEPAV